MRIAVDISPLKTGHKVRGIGSYTEKLVNEFKNREWGVEFIFFENPSSPPLVDVIHYPYFDLFFRTLPLRKITKRVITIHDVIPLVFPQYFPAGIKGYVNLFFQKKALKNTDFIICDSETSKKDIVDKLLYPESQIRTIYLAPGSNFKKVTDDLKLKEISKQFKLPKDFVLYVGDVNWNKNLKGLIEAVKIAKVNLVMVGNTILDAKIPETREINRLIRKFNLGKKIIKTGYIPEEILIAIYNLAKLTILPSFYEGFGLPVLESMACGTPVVCSKGGSLAEIGGKAAILCDSGDPDDIAAKVDYVLNLSKKEREKLGEKLQKHASMFTWEKTAQETIKIYQRVFKEQ